MELMLDAETYRDRKHIAITIQVKEGVVDTELRFDAELEDAKRFHQELGDAIKRSEETL